MEFYEWNDLEIEKEFVIEGKDKGINIWFNVIKKITNEEDKSIITK